MTPFRSAGPSLLASLTLVSGLSLAGSAAGRPGAPPPALPAPLRTQEWTTGRGEPQHTVVFLHGLGGKPHDQLLERLIASLERRGEAMHVVAPWLRPVALGDPDERGERPIVSTGPHLMSEQLDKAREAIRAQPGRVFLVGHSFGGKAALALQREMPDKIAGVIAFAPSVNMLYAKWKDLTGERGLPDPETVTARLNVHMDYLEGRLREAQRHGTHDERVWLRSEISYLKTMIDLVQFEPAIERDVQGPLLHLFGEGDRAVSVHYARRFDDVNPAVQHHEYPHLDHGLVKVDDHKVDHPATEAATEDMVDRMIAFMHANARPQ
jgi:pimeloyl-ACP methyl ester carboxylesterase